MDELYRVYKTLDRAINNSPFLEDCPEQINCIYNDIAVLKDKLFDAGFDKKPRTQHTHQSNFIQTTIDDYL